jgi:hypothetical protein
VQEPVQAQGKVVLVEVEIIGIVHSEAPLDSSQTQLAGQADTLLAQEEYSFGQKIRIKIFIEMPES